MWGGDLGRPADAVEAVAEAILPPDLPAAEARALASKSLAPSFFCNASTGWRRLSAP